MASNTFGKGLFYPQLYTDEYLKSSSIFDSDEDGNEKTEDEKALKVINCKIKKLKKKKKKIENKIQMQAITQKLDKILSKFDDLINLCSNIEISKLFKDQ